MKLDFHFDTNYFEIYHRLLSGERDRREAEFIAQFIPGKDSKVADFGCGWGRHLLELAKMGYTNLNAVDFAENLLDRARVNLINFPRVKFVHSEFVNFKSTEKFDLIYQTFQSFGYRGRDYDLENISVVSKYLKIGGRYLLDVRNPDKLRRGESFDMPGGIKVDASFDRVSRRERFVYHFNGNESVAEFNVYSLSEFRKMFKVARLKVVQVLGDFDGSEYNESSQRLIIVGKKI